MKNNLPFCLSVAGFVSAIFISSFVKLGFSFFLLFIFLSIAIFLFQKFFVSDIKNNKIIFLIFLFIFSFSLGILRYEIKEATILDENLENYVGKSVVVEALVSEEPAEKESKRVFTADFRNIIVSGEKIPVFGKGTISSDLYPECKYGDAVEISGKLEKPENFDEKFDYISYLAKDDIFYKIDFAKVSVISEGNGNFIKENLFKLKRIFTGRINKTIPEPEASLLSGILLGARSSLDEKTQDTFQVAGVSHIVALSGYNITVVAEAIMKFLSFLPNNYAFSGGIFGIILFVILTGASSTAIRAGIMAVIVMIAGITGRKYQAGRALVIAGVFMVVVNPKILVFDLSFQLSFLATIAIIYFSPLLAKKLSFVTEKCGLRNIVSSTISAQVLVLPLLLYKMGMLSFVSLPANILILPFIPATMLFGFLAVFFSPFAWISWFLLAYIIKVSEFFAGLPFSSLDINWFSSIIMILCYILIGLWFLKEK